MTFLKSVPLIRRAHRRHYVGGISVLAAGLAVTSFTLLGSMPVAASGLDAVSGSAFGASVTLVGTSVVPPTPTVTLPPSGLAQSASIVTIPTNPVVTTGVATVNTAATNATDATEVVSSSSDIANPALVNSLAPGITSLLSADAIHSVCQSSATGSTGGTTIVSLVLDGMPVPVSDAVDQIPAIPAPLSSILSLEINKQVITNSAGATGITVDGLVITLLSAAAGGGVVTLAQSVCGATGPDINAAPTVSGIAPASGPTTGGTTVTLTGSGFNCVSAVTFGTTPAASYTVISPTQITAVSPPGVAGGINVTVKNCNATSPISADDLFTYVSSSAIPAAPVSPLSDSVAVTG